MNRSVLSCLSLVSLVSLVGLSACGSTPAPTPTSDTSVAGEAIDSASVSQQELALMVPAAEGSGSAKFPELMARSAAAAAGNFYSPAGCFNATSSRATVTYTLTDCSGPYGLANVSGEIQVTYSIVFGGIGLAVSGSGITASGASLDLSATGVYAASGSSGKIDVTSQSSGKGPLGNTVEHSGNYTGTWDTTTMCAGISGNWTTSGAAGRKWSTSVSSLQACASGCPAARGQIVYTGGVGHDDDVRGHLRRLDDLCSTAFPSGPVPRTQHDGPSGANVGLALAPRVEACELLS